MPNITVINLLNLEADFIPYYLITRKFIDDTNGVNIIYSNDHDLLQCTNENTFVFAKSAKGKRIVKESEAMKDLLKRETNIEPKYVPLGLSIVGDTGDDVDGIKGIGPKRFLDIFEDLISTTGGIEKIYENIENFKPIFHTNLDGNLNKYTNDVISEEQKTGLISTNLRLTSFELISRAVEDPINTEMLKRKKQIDNLFNSDKVIVDCQTIREALERNGVFFDGDTLENVYYRS
jgi:5'-3' exonuclease